MDRGYSQIFSARISAGVPLRYLVSGPVILDDLRMITDTLQPAGRNLEPDSLALT
jgi:hypothetical protein